MSYQVTVSKTAQKQIEKLPFDIKAEVNKQVEAFEQNPRPRGCKKLVGTKNEYRIRIGRYRMRYDIDDKLSTVVINSCLLRKDAYKAFIFFNL